MKSSDELFLVYWRPASGELRQVDGFRLDDGLWLVRASATRAELYDHVDGQLKPEFLLVARLAGTPKLTGTRRDMQHWLEPRDTP